MTMIKVKYTEVNDPLGKFSYATPSDIEMGRSYHADSLAEIKQKVYESIQIVLEDTQS